MGMGGGAARVFVRSFGGGVLFESLGFSVDLLTHVTVSKDEMWVR
jgi:hypothetical protein